MESKIASMALMKSKTAKVTFFGFFSVFSCYMLSVFTFFLLSFPLKTFVDLANFSVEMVGVLTQKPFVMENMTASMLLMKEIAVCFANLKKTVKILKILKLLNARLEF